MSFFSAAFSARSRVILAALGIEPHHAVGGLVEDVASPGAVRRRIVGQGRNGQDQSCGGDGGTFQDHHQDLLHDLEHADLRTSCR
jgi:hypothetical protein